MTTIGVDQKHIWHPFTQETIAPVPIPIAKAEGAVLLDEGGKEYLDMISSWWVNIHGHCHPKITEAITEQVQKLAHVMFAGFTHEPALKLSSKLCELLPGNKLSKVFFSDSGSFAVETALKIALQYWHNKGQKNRTRFISFQNGYHGDSFGAMSVGKTCGFNYAPFESHLFTVDFVPYASTWIGDEDIENKEKIALEALKLQIIENGKNTAALIIEPLIQAAGGFHFCRPEFIQAVVKLCNENQILVIFDEVMTGFGRTGKMFACEKAGAIPDIICLAKGMSGGFLPIAATITSQEVYDAFVSNDINNALLHGSTYAANPLGCASANASLSLFEEENTLAKIEKISQIHLEKLTELAKKLPIVTRPRVMGDVAAFNLSNKNAGYNAKIGQLLKPKFLEHGLLIRPFGNVIHIMPPYCITEEQLNYTYDKIEEILNDIPINYA